MQTLQAYNLTQLGYMSPDGFPTRKTQTTQTSVYMSDFLDL